MIDIRQLRAALSADAYWSRLLSNAWDGAAARVHLAVFVQPFLGYVLDGSKTVESRFSVNATSPYGRVTAGDLLLLKRSGGPIVGVSRAADVWQYELNRHAWQQIKRQFSQALRLDGSDFLERKANASFATLILLDHVRPIAPVLCEKRDRRGWVVLRDKESQRSLFSTPRSSDRVDR